jgi:hypothetical protein
MSLVFPFSKGSLVNLPNGNFKKTYTMKTHFDPTLKKAFPIGANSGVQTALCLNFTGFKVKQSTVTLSQAEFSSFFFQFIPEIQIPMLI